MKMGKQRLLVGVVLSLLSLVGTGTAFGHHGTNISYDHTKPITLTGTVSEFIWKNPHSQLYFDVKDAAGKVTKWGGELNSPSVLGREGWTKHQFKAGDVITLTVFPSKAGTPVGVIDRTHPIMANGKEVVAANARNVD
jgi:hypothetical protein